MTEQEIMGFIAGISVGSIITSILFMVTVTITEGRHRR